MAGLNRDQNGLWQVGEKINWFKIRNKISFSSAQSTRTTLTPLGAAESLDGFVAALGTSSYCRVSRAVLCNMQGA
jgi:hypothetical protein